jgi:hypothetical protein
MEMGTAPYPIFLVYASQTVELSYAITKAMIAGYPAYKDAAPGASGLAAERQTKNWVIPVHAGAVRALTEAAQWSADDEAHNKMLLKRQAVLAEAWKRYLGTNPPADKDAFRNKWMEVRRAALVSAALEPVF